MKNIQKKNIKGKSLQKLTGVFSGKEINAAMGTKNTIYLMEKGYK